MKPFLRCSVLELLLTTDANEKAAGTRALDLSQAIGTLETLTEPDGIPGRPLKPALLPHTAIKSRSVRTPEGHAALLHAICHIELNAVDLALDAVWRFEGLPNDYYLDWLRVAQEEALHFSLLRDHLATLGFAYGDFPAHNSLWEMADRTRHDVLARMALVPRTLEARGLDASPAVKAKLLSIDDEVGASIIDLILRDEIGHVAVGNRWYRWLCGQRGVDPISTYGELATEHRAPRLRGPFNLEARRASGFQDDEIAALLGQV
jgi:uncharacterized ferritin-like protein (DUF455 family)